MTENWYRPRGRTSGSTDARPELRQRLDKQFRELGPLDESPFHYGGWIRTIRNALGMSSSELARRIGVSQQAALEMERSEGRLSIKLATLQNAGDGLDCELVYFLLPRTSLEHAVATQALRKAGEHLDALDYHERFERNALAGQITTTQLDSGAAALVDRRGLWTNKVARHD